MKDEFLATLSHELRTPLNAVLGWAHMLRVGAMAPAVKQRALESLERNARVQAQLVEDLPTCHGSSPASCRSEPTSSISAW